MHCLTTLMEDDRHLLLAQQIFLYLPLVDLLDCKYVSRLWRAHMERLLKCESTHWSHPELARKAGAAFKSITGGVIVQKLDLSEAHFEELTKSGYELIRCAPFKGLLVLQFRKRNLNRWSHWVYALALDNINEVRYVKTFTCRFGNHYFVHKGSSIVIWWYIIGSNDYLELNYILLDDLTSFREKAYTTKMHVSDFVSPAIALEELISRDSSLRSAIKMKFPGLNVHTNNSLHVCRAHFRDHEMFLHTRPSQEATELWVLNRSTMDVEIKRNTRQCDWICKRDNLPEIAPTGYRHPVAVFRIKTKNALAVWDLSQPGHPRHVTFDVQLPMNQWHFNGSYMSRSKWIIAIYEDDKDDIVHYINANFTPKHSKNTLAPCECVAQETQQCHLEEQKLTLQAITSSHTPKVYEYFIGDRFIVQRTLTSKEVYIMDFWKPQDYTKVNCNIAENWVTSFKRIVIRCLKRSAK